MSPIFLKPDSTELLSHLKHWPLSVSYDYGIFIHDIVNFSRHLKRVDDNVAKLAGMNYVALNFNINKYPLHLQLLLMIWQHAGSGIWLKQQRIY